ncbi:MAG: FecR domain-containing protein [Clostridiales bacterium]|nr:FecR domain-containing protein [Clostridiales bacterium]
MNKKLIAIIAVAAVLVAAVVTTLVIVFTKDDSYRLLKLYEFEGTGAVTREGKGEITPYANMVLESGDNIRLDTGRMTIQADEDKYIHLDEHTEIELVASGKGANTKTKIQLLKGGISNDIRNKLSADSSYEINTPNSTMSVRGTVFYTFIYEIDGVKYTRVCVFEGVVTTHLVYKDGTVEEKEVLVGKGKEVIIYEDGTTTDYLYDEPQDIDYDTIPENVLRDLRDLIDNDGKTLSITSPEITQILEGPYNVTFMFGDIEFGTQVVEKGKTATIPSLSPSAVGGWDFDFNEPIERNTKIDWIQ